MASLYHSLFTEKGLELLRTAIQSGTKLGITHMSFGDGNGVLPTPDAKFTSMVKEVYRVPLNRLAASKENANWLEADGVIPSAVGGFNIREVGLWAGDIMVAYANYPPTYKPTGDQGTAQIKTIRIVLQIDNTANFELKIDASVVMATIQTVEEAKLAAIQYADNTKLHVVDSINDLATLEVWHGRTINVKGLQGGTFTYNENKQNINDGVVTYNGWVRLTYETVYRSEWVGVTGIEGDDCVPKLKKLFEYVANLGGGTVIIQDGVHSLNTVYVDNKDGYTEHYAFGMYNNVTIEGTSRDKTIFKVKDNLIAEAPQRWGLFVDNHRNDINNFTARKFKVDFNGYNNLCTETVQPVHVVILVWDAYKAKNITFDNIWCDKNATWNSFFIGSKCENASITNCLFTEHSDSILNNLIKDHSTIYINGSSARIESCVFLIPDNVTSYISTAIEAHGTNTIVTGCLVKNYGAPFLAASTEKNRHDDVTFTSNIATGAQLGFAFNSLNGTLKTSFTGNTVKLRGDKAQAGTIRYAHAAIESAGAINTIADRENSFSDVYVIGNTFEQATPIDWIDADMYINSCQSIKEVRRYVSKNNTFVGFKGAALSVLVHRTSLGSILELDGNKYISCGRAAYYTVYDGVYRLEGLPFTTEDGIDYNLLDKINIQNESFTNCAYGVLFTKQDDLTARKINISNINYQGNFIPPCLLNKPVDLISGHVINLEYHTEGFVELNHTLSNNAGVTGKLNLKNWSKDFSKNNNSKVEYVKSANSSWNLRMLSSVIPKNGELVGAFANSDGDRIDAITALLGSFSSYIYSNNKWLGIGKVENLV